MTLDGLGEKRAEEQPGSEQDTKGGNIVQEQDAGPDEQVLEASCPDHYCV